MDIDDQIDFLEESLRKIKAKYDLFFAGSIRLPPSEDRRRIDVMVHEMSRNNIRDNARRFRFNTLVGRYNMYRELWARRMREREEGPRDYRKRLAALGGEPTIISGGRKSVTSPPTESYVKVARVPNGEAYEKLYAEISEAQRNLGVDNPWTLQQVSAMVQKQAEALRSRFGVDTIAFRVETVDGKVKLKAKPA